MIQHLAPARAPSLLLSAAGMTIKDITQIYQVARDTVATWSRQGERDGPPSLHEQPRRGRPPKLPLAEHTLAIASIKEEPRSLKQVGSGSPSNRPSASGWRPSNVWPNEPVFAGSGGASHEKVSEPLSPLPGVNGTLTPYSHKRTK